VRLNFALTRNNPTQQNFYLSKWIDKAENCIDISTQVIGNWIKKIYKNNPVHSHFKLMCVCVCIVRYFKKTLHRLFVWKSIFFCTPGSMLILKRWPCLTVHDCNAGPQLQSSPFMTEGYGHEGNKQGGEHKEMSSSTNCSPPNFQRRHRHIFSSSAISFMIIVRTKR
jgi:hypothetical protein